MSVARQIVRIIFFPVIIFVAGTIMYFGFAFVLEPMYSGFGEPSTSLGWGTPGLDTLGFISAGMVGLLVVIILWFVYAPIREDIRQEVR